MSECPICRIQQPFEARILPCEVIICTQCAQSIYERNGKVFGCEICHKFHDMPRNGFQALSIEVCKSTYARNIFKELEQQTNQSQTNGRCTIQDFFQDLRNQIHRETEIAMKAIQESNEYLINEVNLFEKQKEKEYDDVFYEWNNSILVNHKECEKLVHNDDKLVKAIQFAEKFKANFNLATIENKIFKGVVLKFEKNPILFDVNLIGKLKLQKMKSIDYSKLVKSNLSEVITDVDRSSLDSIKIESFDNGNIFIAHRMVNKYFKYSVLNKDKSLEGITLDEKYIQIISCKQKNNHVFIYSETEESFMMKILDQNIQKSMVSLYFKRFVGVNDSYLYCISNKTTNKPLFIYNWKLQLITSLGQRDNPKRPFFFPSDIKQIDNKDGKYFWLNSKSLTVINELNGSIQNSVDLNADKFIFDSKSNLILICKTSKKLVFFSYDGCLLQEFDLYNFPLHSIEFYLDKNEKLNFFDKSTLELSEL